MPVAHSVQTAGNRQVSSKEVRSKDFRRSLFLFGPSLFSRCLWFAISPSQRIALETLDTKHSIPYYSMFFPEQPKRLYWVLRAAQDFWRVYHLERWTLETAGLEQLLWVHPRAGEWVETKISASCTPVEYYGQPPKKGKCHLKCYNCPHMWSVPFEI